jgi:hypothetical protein
MQFVGGWAVHFAFASTLTVGGRKWCDRVPGPASFSDYILYYSGFDSRTVQTFVCMNMSVCIGSGCFYV